MPFSTINGVVTLIGILLHTRVFGVVEEPTMEHMRYDWDKLSDEKSSLHACYVTEWRTFTEWRNNAHHIWTRQWKVDFYRFDVRVSMLAWVGRFPQIRSFHAPQSCADSLFRPSKFKSWLTHSPQVLLPLPLLFTPITSNSLQEDTQSSFLLRFKCPYHLSCPVSVQFWEFPKNPNDVVTSQIFIQATDRPVLQNCRIRTFHLKRFGHG